MSTMTTDIAIHPGALSETRPRQGKIRGLMARHQLVAFFVLAFVFSWYPWIIAICRGRTSGPNPLGPLIAALIVTGLAEGRAGMRTLLGRLVRVRIGLQWYALIIG